MKQHIVSILMLLLLFTSSTASSANIIHNSGSFKAYSGTIWHVNPGESIQLAINAANPGDTILVHTGTYHEALLVNKPLMLIGDGASTTIINGTGVALVTTGLVRITAEGDVTFSGFTVTNAEPVGANHVRIAVLTECNTAGPTYTISDNVIYGSNNPDEEEDYGFYASYGKENIIFTRNVISKTGSNNMVLECHTGATQISYNILDAGVWGTDSIFFMTYDGIDVTNLQNVSHNAFDMGTGGPFDYDHRATAVSFSSPGPAWGLGEAKFTNMVIAGNTINNLESYRRGIGFWNGGTGDDLQSPVVTGNTINGEETASSWGIDFIGGLTSNALVTHNNIQHTDTGIYLRTAGSAPAAKINYNNILNNAVGINWTLGPSVVDARFNWWGSETGPACPSNPSGIGDDITSNVDYSPWLEDPFEVTPRTYHVNPTGTIQEAINEASSGDTIMLSAGTYTEGPQFAINKNLALRGIDASATIIKASGDTGSSGDSRGWFLIGDGVTFSLVDVTIDGLGHSIYQAIRDKGQGTIADCIFKNIVYPGYAGFAVVAFGGNVNVINCAFTNIGRVGVLYFGSGITSSVFSGNSYSGKYNGDWLDYGVEVGAGAHVTISGNTISKCTGIASVDGSTSAGILVTTYYGEGSQATITHNDISNCTYGVGVGYDESDTSLVFVHENNIYNNEHGLDTTAPTIDAARNWWGDPTGPYNSELNPSGKGDSISDNVKFEPWLIKAYPPPVPVETVLYIDPEKTELWTPSYNYVFKVDVKVANVINLTCYEFKLYWNTTLLDFDYACIIEIWPLQIKWEKIDESLGRYWLGVAARGEDQFTGDTTLIELYFKVKYDPIYPNNVHSLLDLDETVLGDTSEPIKAIPHMVRDGEYWCYSTKPEMKVDPLTSTVKKLGEIFSVSINMKDVVELYDFEFWFYYNTTLLDIYNPIVELGPLMSGATIYAFGWDDVAGYIHFAARLTTPAPPVNGSGTIAIITFQVAKASIWPDPDLQCTLNLVSTKIKTKGGIEVPHDEIDGLYVYKPVIGDLTCDGTVDLDDIYIISLAYGSKPGDGNWNRIADLTRDNKVDVLDLRTAARHYGEDC
jgi:hypothetical protein